MNKSILKHELRSMRWMAVLSILASLALTIIFGIYLHSRYINIFNNGIHPNEALIVYCFRKLTLMILVVFIGLSIIQVFAQFRSEKNQETARFLKSLPVKREEFLKIKLITGIINISLAFIVLAIGLLVVRNNNMFWIKDIHNISFISEVIIIADSSVNLLKELGLLYLVVLTFYSFLFMVQYTFSNVVGGIVTGILVWLAPMFIIEASIFALDSITIDSIYNITMVNRISNFSEWLLPSMYPSNHNHILLNSNTATEVISVIANLGMKYIVSLAFILVNIALAYKLNKGSKIENENMIIPFKSIQRIFEIGVAICSGLVVSLIFGDTMMVETFKIGYVVLIAIASFIGYLVSRKITKIGSI